MRNERKLISFCFTHKTQMNLKKMSTVRAQLEYCFRLGDNISGWVLVQTLLSPRSNLDEYTKLNLLRGSIVLGYDND